MAFLKQTLTLSTTGASLIASNSFWFFDFFGLQPFQNVSVPEQIGESTPNTPPSTKAPSKKTMPNMNGFRTASKHVDITGKPLKNANLKPGSLLLDMGFYFTLGDQPKSKDKYMSKITSLTMEDFTLTLFEATEQQYIDFPKESIKISLFTKAAWYSEIGEDEYSLKVNETQIKELFEGKDEAKVKQLLLSLHKRLDWKKLGQNDQEPPSRFNSELIYPKNLDPLSDLKIKYFKDFDSLKEYVHKKVTTCVGEIACIANQEELDIMDTDRPSFFENLKNPKSS